MKEPVKVIFEKVAGEYQVVLMDDNKEGFIIAKLHFINLPSSFQIGEMFQLIMDGKVKVED